MTSLIFSEEIKKQRDWRFKRLKICHKSQADNFPMNFLITASKNNFYGIMANCKINNSKIFWYFLINVWNWRTIFFIDNSVSIFCFFIDNTSIHKTKKIKELWEENRLNIIMIPSYWPSLNPIETSIHAIKMKGSNVRVVEGKHE